MTVTLRPGRLEDSAAVFRVFRDAVIELGDRLGVTTITAGGDPAVLANLWESRRPLFDHLARTAAHFWIAESGGEPVGYARSTLRDGVLELTDFFVLPQAQGAGVGTALLARAFPRADERYRVVIATQDARALTRYLKAGCYARFPIQHFSRPARVAAPTADLSVESLDPSPGNLELLAQIDHSVLGFRRDADHAWLLTTRRGLLYRRDGRVLGYGYTGSANGPFAAFDEADLPLMLAGAESLAPPGAEFGVDVPLVNRRAVDYLLTQGFRMGAFTTFLMTDAPLGRFDAYIITTPGFFL